MSNKVKALFIAAAFIGLTAGALMADVSYTCNFSQPGLKINQMTEAKDGNTYQKVELDGCFLKTVEYGSPELPVKDVQLLIPAEDEVYAISVDDFQKTEIALQYKVYPAQPPISLDLEVQPPAFVPANAQVYASVLPYPEQITGITGGGYLSGYHIVNIKVNPVRYRPGSNKLELYTSIRFTVKTRPGKNPAVPVGRRSPVVQKQIDDLVKAIAANPGAVAGQSQKFNVKSLKSGKQGISPVALSIKSLPTIEGSNVDYLIITNEALKPGFQILADWKTRKGMIADIRTVEWIGANYQGCDLQEKIRNFIKDAYAYWGTGYVLLAGDVSIIPERECKDDKDNVIPTDIYYSDLEGSYNADGDDVFGEGPYGLYPTLESFSTVDYITALVGFAKSENKLLKTTDGGVNWTGCGEITPKYAKFYDVSHGFAVQTYTDVPPPPPASGVVSAGNDNVTDIYYTGDAGANWLLSYQVTDVDNYCLANIFCLDIKHVWAWGKSLDAAQPGLLAFTLNGSVWSEVKLSVIPTDLLFIDGSAGYLTGGSGVIMKTTNGGASWQTQNSGTDALLRSLFFLDANHGWACGENGTILHYDGINWTAQTEGLPEDFKDITFTDASNGIAIGGSKMFRTANGGTTWVEVYNPASYALNAVDFADQSNGLIVGDNGLIMKTTDGGLVWSVLAQGDLTAKGDKVDLYPDLAVGRLPVENLEQTDIMLSKILKYEQNPEIAYLTKMLFMGGSIMGTSGMAAQEAEKFQLDYPAGAGIPQNFTKRELYSPKDDPSGQGLWLGDEELSKTTALNNMQTGYHFIWHCDHSSEYMMGTGMGIQPYETRSINRVDVEFLGNNNEFSIVYSNGCDPNKFTKASISEHFMKNRNGGAIGFMGNSIAGALGYEWQATKIFQTLFHSPVNHLGDAFRSMQGTNLDAFCAFNQNLLGDPGLRVWTNAPQQLVVEHHPASVTIGQNIVTVTVLDNNNMPVEGALVCLQKGYEAYALGYSDILGQVTFNYTPETAGQANITVTAQNYFPYQGACAVLATEEGYICYDRSQFDDDNEDLTIGNGDGILNPGETVDMWLTVKNTGGGFELIANVSLSTNDQYISPKTFSTAAHNIYSGQSQICDAPYTFTVAPDCPDQHNIVFYMTTNTGQDSFAVKVLADSLELNHFKLVEVIGNGNGLIENNETMELQYLTINNLGSGNAGEVTAELSTTQNGINITQNTLVYNEIQAGTSVGNQQSFLFSVSANGPYNFNLVLKDKYGRQWSRQITLYQWPSPPAGLTVLPAGEVIELRWVSDANTNIYRSLSLGGPYQRLNASVIKKTPHYYDKDIQAGKTYYYAVTKVDINGVESDYSPEVSNYTTPFCAGWPVTFGTLADYNWNTPAIGDIDGDGYKEIIFAGAGDSVFTWRHDGSRQDGWPKKYLASINGAIALADMDKDGILEIVMSTGDKILCLKGDGTVLFQWQAAYRVSSPVVSDINQDGLMDIIYIAKENQKVGAITWESNEIVPLWLFSYDLPYAPMPAPVAVGDITGDSHPEIVFGTSGEDAVTFALNYNGQLLPNWPQNGGYIITCAPCLADVNGDGKMEVVLGSLMKAVYDDSNLSNILKNSQVNVWLGNGSQMPGWPYSDNTLVEKFYWSTPVVCDFNGDGDLEIAASSLARIKVWSSIGSIIKDQPVDASHSSLLPIDNNNADALLYRVDSGEIGAISNSANIAGFPIKAYDGSFATPALSDINNDGNYELLSDAMNGNLYAWQLNIPVNGPTAWPMQGHDAMRTSRHSALIDYHGHINRNMTLSGDNYLSGDIVIDPGVTVNILPGARLYFAANKDAHDQGADALRGELIVKGELLVQGAVGDSVYLGPWTSAPAAGNWHGIVVETGGNVQLDYCVIENAVVGLQSVNVNVLPQISVTNSRIQGCNTGFYFNNSAAQIKNNLIVDNKPPAMFGKGVFKASSDTFAGKSVDSTVFIGTGIEAINSNLTLENNVIRNNFIGYYGGGSIQGAITNNTFEDNEYQGMDLYGDGFNMTITGNNFYRNAVPLNGTNGWEWAGISIGYREISTASSIIIEGNTFTGNHTGARCTRYGSEAIAAGFSLIMRDNNFSTGNEVGLKIATDVSPNLTAIATGNYFTGNTIYGVYVNAVNSCPLNLGDLSNASLTDNGGNRIYNNGIYDLYYAVPTPIAMKAEGNFWNKKLASQIDPRIYDDNENSAYGSVDFQPFYIWDWPEEDAVWSGVVSIAGDVVVPEDGTLKIEPGTVVRFIRDFDAAAGGNDPAKAELIIYGQLELKGKPGEPPVIFQSDAHSPQSGDWGGIVFKQAIAASKACTEVALRGSGTKGVSTREMKNCIVRHAVSGISLGGDQKLELKQCKLEQNATGLSFYGQATAECKDDTIANNNTGIACKDYSVPIFKNSYLSQNKNNGVVINDNAQPNFGDDEECGHNIISSNLPYNIYNASNNNIMAKKNYWGTMNVDTVAKYIFDGNDQSGLGLVSYLPLWEGPRDRPHGGAQLEESAIALPTTFSMLQNTPNPMVGFTAINFAVAKPGNVSLKIYNISGQLVKTLVNENKQQGFYNVKWDGKDESFQQTAAGVYFYRIQANGFDNTKKMVVLK